MFEQRPTAGTGRLNLGRAWHTCLGAGLRSCNLVGSSTIRGDQFAVTAAQMRSLDDHGLVELLRDLLFALARIHVPAQINVPDDGEDGGSTATPMSVTGPQPRTKTCAGRSRQSTRMMPSARSASGKWGRVKHAK